MKFRSLSEAPAWPPGIAISDDPVRRIHTRSRRRNTSLVFSTLTLGMREAESQPETLFLQVAQLDPGVSLIRAQPCWLRVVEDGRVRRRAPDFALLYGGLPEMHEVKQDHECWKPEVRSELLSVRDEVERHPPWRYSVSLESVLRAEPLRSNTALLWRALRPADEVDGGLVLRTSDHLESAPIPAAELIGRTRRDDDRAAASGSWDNLLTMIALGLVDYDVRQLLTPDSLVWNHNSGPRRGRTLPFGTVEAAITRPIQTGRPDPFCSLPIRRRPR